MTLTFVRRSISSTEFAFRKRNYKSHHPIIYRCLGNVRQCSWKIKSFPLSSIDAIIKQFTLGFACMRIQLHSILAIDHLVEFVFVKIHLPHMVIIHGGSWLFFILRRFYVCRSSLFSPYPISRHECKEFPNNNKFVDMCVCVCASLRLIQAIKFDFQISLNDSIRANLIRESFM